MTNKILDNLFIVEKEIYTEFIKPGASVESRWDRTGQRIFFCPVLSRLDSMLAAGFMNSVYGPIFSIKFLFIFLKLKSFGTHLRLDIRADWVIFETIVLMPDSAEENMIKLSDLAAYHKPGELLPLCRS